MDNEHLSRPLEMAENNGAPRKLSPSRRGALLVALRTLLYEQEPAGMMAFPVTGDRVRAMLPDTPELYTEICAAWNEGWNLRDWLTSEIERAEPAAVPAPLPDGVAALVEEARRLHAAVPPGPYALRGGHEERDHAHVDNADGEICRVNGERDGYDGSAEACEEANQRLNAVPAFVIGMQRLVPLMGVALTSQARDLAHAQTLLDAINRQLGIADETPELDAIAALQEKARDLDAAREEAGRLRARIRDLDGDAAPLITRVREALYADETIRADFDSFMSSLRYWQETARGAERRESEADARAEEMQARLDEIAAALTHGDGETIAQAVERHRGLAAECRVRGIVASARGLASRFDEVTRELDAAREQAESNQRRREEVWHALQQAEQERDAATQRYAIEWRGVEHACDRCGGAGVRAYPSTATWRGGRGGQTITGDVCDRCWGSGDAPRPWPSWRVTEAAVRRAEAAERERDEERDARRYAEVNRAAMRDACVLAMESERRQRDEARAALDCGRDPAAPCERVDHAGALCLVHAQAALAALAVSRG